MRSEPRSIVVCAGDRGDPPPDGARRVRPRLRLGLRPRRRGALQRPAQGKRGVAAAHCTGNFPVFDRPT